MFEKLRVAGAGSARVEQMQGEAAVAAGNREAAEKHLRAALAARVDLRGVRYQIGELYLAAGDFEKAEKEFRAETGLAPGSAAAAYKLGSALLSLGRTKEASGGVAASGQLTAGDAGDGVGTGKGAGGRRRPFGRRDAFSCCGTGGGTSSLAAAAHLQLSQIYRKLGREADAARELEILKAIRAKRTSQVQAARSNLRREPNFRRRVLLSSSGHNRT